MIEIIPAIDLIDGKCVRLRQGDFEQQTVYSANPVETAKQFAAAGVRRLHLVDLDGARKGAIQNLPVLERIARETDLIIDFGGGVKNMDDAQAVFDAGAQILTVGSLAAREPATFELFLREFGGEKVLLGADARDGKIAVNGWQIVTDIDLLEFLRSWQTKGVTQTFVTDIARDGMMQGASTALYQSIKDALPELALIASGGVNSMEDLRELETAGCAGAIVGKAIYENRISLEQLRITNYELR